jgi:hypothetical protein
MEFETPGFQNAMSNSPLGASVGGFVGLPSSDHGLRVKRLGKACSRRYNSVPLVALLKSTVTGLAAAGRQTPNASANSPINEFL